MSTRRVPESGLLRWPVRHRSLHGAHCTDHQLLGEVRESGVSVLAGVSAADVDIVILATSSPDDVFGSACQVLRHCQG